MGATAGLTEVVLYDTLVNYLVSMARTVEGAMNRALDAIVSLENPRTSVLPGEVFLLEPRINEMEIVIDEHAIRLLRRGSFSDDEMRLIVAALKITNDLERIGDIAVNLAERVVSLREMQGAQIPEELAPMASAVRAMVSKSLGALIFRWPRWPPRCAPWSAKVSARSFSATWRWPPRFSKVTMWSINTETAFSRSCSST